MKTQVEHVPLSLNDLSLLSAFFCLLYLNHHHHDLYIREECPLCKNNHLHTVCKDEQ